MNDKEIADKLVEDGIGVAEEFNMYRLGKLELGGNDGRIYSDYAFVRDWRVAGMCLEQFPTTIAVSITSPLFLDEMLRDPRAICLSYVEAISDK